jgi:hypothetical protein
MTIWAIKGFSGDEAPHWDAAFVEAETREEAVAWLVDAIKRDRDDTIWGGGPYANPDTSKWSVSEEIRPLRFVLGGGCR